MLEDLDRFLPDEYETEDEAINRIRTAKRREMFRRSNKKRYAYKQEWDKENTTRVSVKLNHNTDEDILQFLLATQSRNGTIKKALREYIARHYTPDDELDLDNE